MAKTLKTIFGGRSRINLLAKPLKFSAKTFKNLRLHLNQTLMDIRGCGVGYT